MERVECGCGEGDGCLKELIMLPTLPESHLNPLRYMTNGIPGATAGVPSHYLRLIWRLLHNGLGKRLEGKSQFTTQSHNKTRFMK